MNICVIGATGVLGRALMTMPNTIACPVRFEESTLYRSWFESHPNVDTVWHVARACRKKDPRRDYKTYNQRGRLTVNFYTHPLIECTVSHTSTPRYLHTPWLKNLYLNRKLPQSTCHHGKQTI